MTNLKATEGFDEGSINERDPKKFVARENVESFTFAGFLSQIMSAITPQAPQKDMDGPSIGQDLEPDDYKNEPGSSPRPGFPG
ncbi:hypothetical protein [Sulfitobacter sp. R18_1]|uniref:hypothetical protein n=1 Tax=Sulfitobacter sp. R18_1 TaxID=2821104 RepID=UPI001ADD18EC|nr:hypothetical protein [Sulfitobacter sp. R18_1]MBO9428415.1 hypothetical protein [Sulfitobacter sp. R18_1]